MPSAIVLVIDGLGAKHIGPYGNTWIETPAFNHLAVESVLLEHAYASFTTPARMYESLWRGTNAIRPTIQVSPPTPIATDGPAIATTNEAALGPTTGLAGVPTGTPASPTNVFDSADGNLISALNQREVLTRLLVDEPDLTDHPLAAHFAEQSELETPSGIKLAENWDETHTANFFAQAVDAVEAMEDNSLLWLHSRGLGNPWDAPYSYRNQFADDDDPDPTGSAQVPSLLLDRDYDPDTLHEIQCAFAGQIVLFDQCLGVLLSVVAERAARSNTLFIVTSQRGFPLGEHRRVGWAEPRLYHELLHVPLLLRYPDQRLAMRRFAGLAETSDMTTALWDWFRSNGETTIAPIKRDFSMCRGADETLLRTPAWQMLFPSSISEESPEKTELYLKPDDQSEVNDVADRCRNVVETGWTFSQACFKGPDSVASHELPELLSERPQ